MILSCTLTLSLIHIFKAKQKNGSDLCAEEIFRETWLWLKARGCEMLVNNQLIEQYAMSVARWIQCEEAISDVYKRQVLYRRVSHRRSRKPSG